MKKVLVAIVVSMLLSLTACEKKLPLPEVSEGLRGDLLIDKNINEETIDNYLNRSDSVYRDMRMLIDDADYEAIDGDSYLSGFIKGFEVVPYPYICNVEELPEEVGETYNGVTLFSHVDGEYVANYSESMEIIEELFPKDKNIFLMCGGGGYAGMTKKLLVALGWDENKIYNIGGYWYYNGENKVEVKYEENGKTKYDFNLVNYHDIDFNKLTKIRESGTPSKNVDEGIETSNFIRINNVDELKQLQEQVKTFPLFVYLSGCSTCAKFFPLVKQFSNENDIQMYAVELKTIWDEENPVRDRIKYAPSMFVFEDGEVVDYLTAEGDEDSEYFKNYDKLIEWFNKTIDINMFESIKAE